MEITGEPGGRFVILAGEKVPPGEGDRVPGGRCEGTELIIGAPDGVLMKFGPITDFDGDGSIVMAPDIPEGACGTALQVMNVDDCTTSGGFGLPFAEGPVDPVPLGRCDLDSVMFDMNGREIFDDSWTSTGSDTMAYLYEGTEDLTIDGVELFTGETTASANISIWSNNPTTTEPEILLTGGEWNMEAENQWQGPVFDRPVELLAGTSYWILMKTTGADYATSRAMGGIIVTYKWSPDGVVWNGPFTNTDKYRMVTCR
jgi:hypothetical protein